VNIDENRPKTPEMSIVLRHVNDMFKSRLYIVGEIVDKTEAGDKYDNEEEDDIGDLFSGHGDIYKLHSWRHGPGKYGT
jgi:hypothetical protein